MHPIITNISLELDKPSPSDKKADRERLIESLSLKTGNSLPVEISLDVVRRIPHALRSKDFSVNATVCFMSDRIRIMDVDRDKIYGIAVDIGTTNIVASLFNFRSNEKVASMEIENPQVSLGLDVLTRVHLSMAGESQKLHDMLMGGINDLVHTLCSANSISHADVFAAAVAGNTIMTHFFLNLPVDNIPVEPYIPAINKIGFINPVDTGIDINANGIVYVFPTPGSYVGGDIISGILYSGLYKNEELSILVDVGTNAEIVLGCKDWIVVGAGAAGPALESGISEIGMRASDGAIYGVDICSASNCRGLDLKLRTIGDKEPVGICGSGMIELVSEMFRTGIINQQGRFSADAENIIDIEGHKGFVICESETGRLIIKDNDIENFLRSKAAMFSSLYVIVKSVGLGFRDIHQIFVSGSFGSGIDADKAVRIGMIPDIERKRLSAIGNSSLKGAEMLLADRHLLSDIDRICSMITYREMNTDGEFMKQFPAAMFIPHTDPDRLRC